MQANKETPLWIWEASDAFPLPNHHVLLINKQTGKKTVVRQDVYNALGYCKVFRTVEEHTKVICSTILGLKNQESNVYQVLNSLADQGVLISSDRILKTLIDSNAHGIKKTSNLDSIYIRTYNRPETLRKLIENILNNDDVIDKNYRFVILDDSTDDELQQINKKYIDNAFGKGKVSFFHYDNKQQQNFIDSLSEKFPELKSVITWFLAATADYNGQSYGRCINHALLLSAGKKFLLMDDDALCSPLQSPWKDIGLSLSNDEEQAWFFDSKENHEQLKPLSLDPFHEHGSVLGNTLASFGNSLVVDSLRGFDSNGIDSLKRNASVKITSNSIAGDPGTGANYWLYLNLNDNAWQQFINNETDYARHRTLRHLWKGYNKSTLSTDKSLMITTLTGIDNTELLLPTFPVFAGEDGLLGSAVKYLYPDALFYQHSWGLPHTSDRTRYWDDSAFNHRLRPALLNFLEDQLASIRAQCHADDVDKRFNYLISALDDISSIDKQAFNRLVNNYSVNAQLVVVNRLDGFLRERPNAPHYWKQHVTSMIKANSPTLDRSESADELYQNWQKYIGDFCEHLKGWPVLWEFCSKNDSHDFQ